ncbi:unnamed protein product, partial [Porites lobata]
PAPNVRTLEGFKFSCWAKGSPPIYTALIKANTVLVNTSETASIQLDQEGNYSCVATSDQGKDTKEFSVSFTGWNSKIYDLSHCAFLFCIFIVFRTCVRKCILYGVSLLGHSPLTYALLLHRDLSLNQITELPHDVFFNVTKLKTLDLSNNNITQLPSKVFSKLTSLTHL